MLRQTARPMWAVAVQYVLYEHWQAIDRDTLSYASVFSESEPRDLFP